MTIGAPKIAVTVLILSSVGANKLRASKSQNRQNKLPPRKHAGIIRIGFTVPNNFLIKCGAATPTKEIGPANATIHADRIPDKITIITRKKRTFTPILFA